MPSRLDGGAVLLQPGCTGEAISGVCPGFIFCSPKVSHLVDLDLCLPYPNRHDCISDFLVRAVCATEVQIVSHHPQRILLLEAILLKFPMGHFFFMLRLGSYDPYLAHLLLHLRPPVCIWAAWSFRQPACRCWFAREGFGHLLHRGWNSCRWVLFVHSCY